MFVDVHGEDHDSHHPGAAVGVVLDPAKTLVLAS
ncbi:hypothetical protein ACNKFW_21895 (plasmid) [Paracoccus sp. TD-10]